MFHDFKKFAMAEFVLAKRVGFRCHLSDFGVTRCLKTVQQRSLVPHAKSINSMTDDVGGGMFMAPEVSGAQYEKSADIFFAWDFVLLFANLWKPLPSVARGFTSDTTDTGFC
jgi:hypothetical protein